MEWQVGQWVTRKGKEWKINGIRPEDGVLMLEGYGSSYADDCKPFAWQVGRTYRTTLDGVTATIVEVEPNTVLGTMSDDTGRWRWNKLTGRMGGCEKLDVVPHLLPFLADEPSEPEPTLTERYTMDHDGGPWWLVRDNQSGKVLTFATRALAEHAMELAKSGEGLLGWKTEDASESQQPDPINPQHYRDHPSGIECIQVVEHMTYCIGNAIKYLWRAGKKGDVVEDLKKAAWYINREIERLAKGGA